MSHFDEYEDFDNCAARADFYAADHSPLVEEVEAEDMPLTGDLALLYADEQSACLVAAYEHGTSEAEMLSLLRAHVAECAACGSTAAIVQADRVLLNPAAVCCEAA